MKKEVKIGIFAVLMICCAWAGVRFLSGIDVFGANKKYYATYDSVSGLFTASPVMIRGVKVGTVTAIEFDPSVDEKVVLELSIKSKYKIATNSTAKIYSDGLMSGKAIQILMGDATTILEQGDTIASLRDPDLMEVAGSELEFFKHHVDEVSASLTLTLNSLNALLETNAKNIEGTLSNLNSMSGTVDGILVDQERNISEAIKGLSKFSTMLGNNAVRMDSIVGSVSELTTQLSKEDFAANLGEITSNLNALLSKLNRGEGAVGMALNDERLYESLNDATTNLSLLFGDFQANPKRYVHFSLFGKSEAKEAEKAQKRAERDSLKMLNK